VLGLATWALVLPLRRRVTDEQVALYLEEHEPTLQNTLISALEADSPAASPALARRTLEQAIERCRDIEDGRRVDRTALNRFATASSAMAIVGIGMALFAPPLLRHGADALLNPFRAAAAVNPYRIQVEPGDATIARGADQVVTATLFGWEERAPARSASRSRSRSSSERRRRQCVPADPPHIVGRGGAVRGPAVRRRQRDGVLHRGGRHAVAVVSHRCCGSAVCREHPAGLRLPGLHRPAR
jgi:hypothetical protein